MATAAQQQAFVSTYGPYANQAGSQLGIPGNLVLAQWAQESGWGAGGGAASLGNMAGINYPGSTTGTNYQSYSSPQAFTNSYVQTMQNPRYASALQAGANNDPTGFSTALGQAGYYSGSQSTYANNVSSNYSTINAMTGGGGVLGGNSSGTAGVSSYEGFGADGSYLGGTTDPTNYPISGAQTYTPVYAGNANTAGSSSAGSGTGTSTAGSTAGSLGADVGYLPPAATGGPQATGLAPGVVTSLNGWITGAETAVGNWMTTALKNVFGSAINFTERGLLILLAVVILGIALWRVMDPDGSKTMTLVKAGAEVA